MSVKLTVKMFAHILENICIEKYIKTVHLGVAKIVKLKKTP